MSFKSKVKRKISLALILIMIASMGFTRAVFAAENKSIISQTDTTQPTLTKTTRDILVGRYYNLNINNKVKGSTYAWSSSDKKVATVSQRGFVDGISKGMATITCKIVTKTDKYKLTCKVTIIDPSTEITIKNKIEAIELGHEYDFDYELLPSTSNDKATWISSDPTIAAPDKDGKVTALGPGTVTITVKTLSGCYDTVTFTVVNPIPPATFISVPSGGSNDIPTPPVTPIVPPAEFPDLGIGTASGAAITQAVTTTPVTAGVSHTFIKRGYLTGDAANKSAWQKSESGPFEVHILTIDPNTYTGLIAAKKCGNAVNAPVNSTSDIIEQGKLDSSIAAVNGGFFMVRDSWGTIGASTSLSVTNGKITNEAIPNRPGVFIPNGTVNGIKIGRFTTDMKLKVTISEDEIFDIPLTGLNRRPGVKCGVNDDYTTHHDNVGYLPNDLILYDNSYGTVTESYTFTKPTTPSPYAQPVKVDLTGVELAINAEGKVSEIYSTMGGHSVAPGGYILAGIGTSADWLKTNVVTGCAITASITAKMDGEPVTFGPDSSVMSAGPLLIKDGVKTTEQSWFDDGFQNATWNGFNPRTLIGIKQDGTVLIVVVDGKSNNSRGATILELQTLMLNLGCYNALNLDGGGSTMMTIDNVMADVTSWGTTPRKVGDYLTLLPLSVK